MACCNAAKSLEDPRKMLDQAVSEMKEDLVKMRQASAEVFSTQKMLETKYKQAQASAVSYSAPLCFPAVSVVNNRGCFLPGFAVVFVFLCAFSCNIAIHHLQQVAYG